MLNNNSKNDNNQTGSKKSVSTTSVGENKKQSTTTNNKSTTSMPNKVVATGVRTPQKSVSTLNKSFGGVGLQNRQYNPQGNRNTSNRTSTPYRPATDKSNLQPKSDQSLQDGSVKQSTKTYDKKPPFNRDQNNRAGQNKRGAKKFGAYNKPQYTQYQYPYSKVILTKRVDKVIAGGRNSSFVAIVVVGNLVDRVGVGTANGKTIVDAITHAKQNAINRVIIPGRIKHIKHQYCASVVIIKRRNIDIIRSAGYLSTIFKAGGMKNISCKLIRSTNTMNAIYAVFDALSQHIQKKRNIMTLRNQIKNQDKDQELLRSDIN